MNVLLDFESTPTNIIGLWLGFSVLFTYLFKFVFILTISTTSLWSFYFEARGSRQTVTTS